METLMKHAPLSALLALAACSADPVLLPDAGPCNGSCGAGTVCVVGACVSVDGGGVDAPGVDTGGGMDAQVAIDVPDVFVQPDGSPLVDQGVDVGAVDAGTDAGPALPDGAMPFLPDGGCPARQGDCYGNAANGCEVFLVTNAHCGECGRACDPSRGVGGCTMASTCAITSCNTSYGDCDGDGFTGCETNILTVENCGMCGRRCSPGRRCLGAPGMCVQ